MVKDAKLLWAVDTHQSKPKCMHTYAQQPSTINNAMTTFLTSKPETAWS